MPSVIFFGGMFNPFHNGHAHVLKKASELSSVKEIILLPNYCSPEKSVPDISIDHRLNMLDLVCHAFNEDQTAVSVSVSDFEISKETTSRTIDTLTHFNDQYQNDSLGFLIGSDSFFSLHKWKSFKDLIDLAEFIVVNRDRFQKEVSNRYIAETFGEDKANRFKFITVPHLEISSTEVRKQLNQSKYDDVEIPQYILRYIQAHQLYKIGD